VPGPALALGAGLGGRNCSVYFVEQEVLPILLSMIPAAMILSLVVEDLGERLRKARERKTSGRP